MPEERPKAALVQENWVGFHLHFGIEDAVADTNSCKGGNVLRKLMADHWNTVADFAGSKSEEAMKAIGWV